MWTLNDVAAESMLQHNAHAATDVTGCGLLGHAWEMAHGSKVNLRLRASAVFWLEACPCDQTADFGLVLDVVKDMSA